MYLADYHTHSATSPDGQLTVSELAEAAVRAGLDEICVTDHVDTVLWGSHAPRDHFDWSGLLAQVPQAREQKEALRTFSDMLGESNYEKRKSFFKKK